MWVYVYTHMSAGQGKFAGQRPTLYHWATPPTSHATNSSYYQNENSSNHTSCKVFTSPEIFRAKYYEICDLYQDFCKLYTDGSVIGDQVGSATVCGTTTKTARLPNAASIFRAELYAITMALNIIYRKKENDFIIFSDSMSSLQAIKGFKLELNLVYQIIKDYSHLTESGKRIVIC